MPSSEYHEKRYTEHIDDHGYLRVPKAKSIDVTPKREGWTPWFVNTVLGRTPETLVYYKPAASPSSEEEEKCRTSGH